MFYKNKKTLVLITGLIGFIGLSSIPFIHANANPKLKLSILFSKGTYMLGEPISPLFELRNESNQPISISDKFSVDTGSLRVVGTKDNINFIGFGNSRWGVEDWIGRTIILPAETKQATAGILWFNDSNGLPAFRLTEAGDYFFKIKYSALIDDGTKTRISLESEPIKITIEEPKGDDLEVWNRIKDNGNFAYFIQEGDLMIPDYKNEERAKFQAEIEKLVSEYPNTFYAEFLRQSVTRFRANEAKRTEVVKQLKKQKP